MYQPAESFCDSGERVEERGRVEGSGVEWGRVGGSGEESGKEWG